jgi:DNA polymerase-3 subunit chi
MATEILFYHLQRQPLEAVLPGLLERSLARGWRCVVEGGNQERLEALDAHLWTYAEESFLPHGLASEPHAADTPVVLTTRSDNPNGAIVRFFVDGAATDDLTTYDRAVILFDGTDEDALSAARGEWKKLKGAGHAPTYWQQTAEGRWEKKVG